MSDLTNSETSDGTRDGSLLSSASALSSHSHVSLKASPRRWPALETPSNASYDLPELNGGSRYTSVAEPLGTAASISRLSADQIWRPSLSALILRRSCCFTTNSLSQ